MLWCAVGVLMLLLILITLRLWLRLHHTRRLMSCLGSNSLARPLQATPPGWWLLCCVAVLLVLAVVWACVQ